MTSKFLAAAAAMILALGVNAGAQDKDKDKADDKPDFSGKWVSVDPLPAGGNAGAGRGGMGGGGRRGGGGGGGQSAGGAAAGPVGFQPGYGSEFTAKQDEKTLTITRGGQSSLLIYKLDGSESKNTVTRNGQEQEQIATAKWDGKALVVVTQIQIQGMAREQRRVLSVEDGKLVIQQTNPGRAASTPIKVVYKKG